MSSRRFLIALSLAAAGLLAGPATAHDRYLLPSHTLVSGEQAQHVSLIASISNDIFHHDKPLGNNAGGEVNDFLAAMFRNLRATVTRPDGAVEALELRAYSRLSAGDLVLRQTGTHRISLVQQRVPMTTFKRSDGTPDRVFGPNPQLPPDARDIVRRTLASRVEAFVSHNGMSPVTLEGDGLELQGTSHPNDLFAGETASFQLFLDGRPLTESTRVQLTREGTRHRNQRNTQEIQTTEEGRFEVRLEQPGFYLLLVEHAAPGKAGSGVDIHHNTLYVTLEAFPE